MMKFLAERFFRALNIPKLAVQMFKAANEISGIEKNTLPRELIPLNSLQLSRGVLNFTVLQSLNNWVLPYWAVKQYDPSSPSFMPRSHLGMSMNLTHRNWTAIGSPESDCEPVVDPAGALMPFRDEWSIEVWIKYKNEIFFPSQQTEIRQNLYGNFPSVRTAFSINGLNLELFSYASKDSASLEAKIWTDSNRENGFSKNLVQIIFAVRPFNAEGIALINDIEYKKEENCFIVNRMKKIIFHDTPDKLLFSDYKTGDAAAKINKQEEEEKKSIFCSTGMATAAAIFTRILTPEEKETIKCRIPLDKKNRGKVPNYDDEKNLWESYYQEATQIKTPDNRLNSLVEASRNTLILLSDSDTITPGPFIYHRFWFRDTAFQLNALDKLNLTGISKKIIKTFSSYQDKDGYYKSQRGEWDSNGQAIWLSFQHALLSNNLELIKDSMLDYFNGIKWIERKRIKKRGHKAYGLLPKGISAEHLGLADYYYWDNFWSIAGIKSFNFTAEKLNDQKALQYAEALEKNYLFEITASLNERADKHGMVPAGPFREPDHGMIGSISPIYPLNILPNHLTFFDKTVCHIYDNYFYDNLFFQRFIHSGGNPYLTLQTGHCFLYTGKRELFNKIIFDVIDHASPTLNYPEAIHPITRGGVMGDGHHGWAAAEFILAVRDAFVYEKDYYRSKEITIVLLGGVPKNWFEQGKEFSIKNAPLLCGRISMEFISDKEKKTLLFDYKSNGIYEAENFIIQLPLDAELESDPKGRYNGSGEYRFEANPPKKIEIRKVRKSNTKVL